MSLTYTGIITMIAGTWLVNTLGLSESCSGELTSKAVEYGPLVIGGILSAWGRLRIGARVAKLRAQVSTLGGKPTV